MLKGFMNKTNKTITGILYKYDTYTVQAPCKNRFKTALTALFKGKILLTWLVRSDKKRKGLYIRGEKKDL